MSQTIWMELEQVIMRPKFDKYITVEEGLFPFYEFLC